MSGTGRVKTIEVETSAKSLSTNLKIQNDSKAGKLPLTPSVSCTLAVRRCLDSRRKLRVNSVLTLEEGQAELGVYQQRLKEKRGESISQKEAGLLEKVPRLYESEEKESSLEQTVQREVFQDAAFETEHQKRKAQTLFKEAEEAQTLEEFLRCIMEEG